MMRELNREDRETIQKVGSEISAGYHSVLLALTATYTGTAQSSLRKVRTDLTAALKAIDIAEARIAGKIVPEIVERAPEPDGGVSGVLMK